MYIGDDPTIRDGKGNTTRYLGGPPALKVLYIIQILMIRSYTAPSAIGWGEVLSLLLVQSRTILPITLWATEIKTTFSVTPLATHLRIQVFPCQAWDRRFSHILAVP